MTTRKATRITRSRRRLTSSLAAPVLLLGALIASPAPASAHDDQTPPSRPGEALVHRVRDLDTRLAALTPDKPRAYFELGEEVESEASSPSDRVLARELFALAFELWRSTPGLRASDPALGASTLLALAEQSASGLSITRSSTGGNLPSASSTSAGDARWLSALARSAQRQQTLEQPAVASSDVGPEARRHALDAASALSLIRGGEGRHALTLLARPEVFDTLVRYERLLDPSGLSGAAERVRTLAAQWPVCSECKNRRSVKGPQGVRLCGTCGGHPGPSLTQNQIAAMLRTEAALLEGSQQSWAAQSIADGGLPLRDPDPAEVARVFGVDAKRALWRGGAWVGHDIQNTKQSE